jgi:membrane-associated phospholipid phosphatase
MTDRSTPAGSTTSAAADFQITWEEIGRALTRPYPVTGPVILLVCLVPFYLVIAEWARDGVVHVPELAIERLLPVVPAWALIYGALYAFLIIVPVIVIQQKEMIRRTVWAYITVWGAAYACFLVYPTVASRPDTVAGAGFAAWGLRFLYEADPPYNCFPSIHVAHSFVSALACSRVHRPLGVIALSCASLVAISTLFTKQHYVADVAVGILLALAAHALFRRGYSRANGPETDRRVAPALALCVSGIVGAGVAFAWVVYRLGFTL